MQFSLLTLYIYIAGGGLFKKRERVKDTLVRQIAVWFGHLVGQKKYNKNRHHASRPFASVNLVVKDFFYYS